MSVCACNTDDVHSKHALSSSLFSVRRRRRKHHMHEVDHRETCPSHHRQDDEVPKGQQGKFNEMYEDSPAVPPEQNQNGVVAEAVVYDVILDNVSAIGRDKHEEKEGQEPRYATPKGTRAARPMARTK